MSQTKVQLVEGKSDQAITGSTLTTTTATTTTLNAANLNSGAFSNRNIIINGAFQVAQRATSNTTDGYGTVDRFKYQFGGTDESPTQAQHALTSSDTGPWEKGFRYSYHITNGNQTSGAGAGDEVLLSYTMENQDIFGCGWNPVSSSSYLTLSFWVKSSVAQTFHGFLLTPKSTRQLYSFSTGALSANTWTKVTKTIPGNSNIAYDIDNAAGILIRFALYQGTNKTGTITQDQWGEWNSSIRFPNSTSTWYTTNDATWEITGVQLEVGETATEFEHRSYGDELQRCKRYYNLYASGVDHYAGSTTFQYNSSVAITPFKFDPEMRDTPTLDATDATNAFLIYVAGSGTHFDAFSGVNGIDKLGGNVNFTYSGTSGQAGGVYLATSSSYIAFSAEL